MFCCEGLIRRDDVLLGRSIKESVYQSLSHSGRSVNFFVSMKGFERF